MVQKAAEAAVAYVAEKTGVSEERARDGLRAGDPAGAGYFVFGWVKSISPLLARLCGEIKATYVIDSTDDGDPYVHEVIVLAENSNPAFELLCESLVTEFDMLRDSAGLPFTIMVHAVDKSDAAAGKAVAVAIGSTTQPALRVWESA